MAIIINRRIAAIPHIDSFLADHPRAVAGWGRKPSGWRAGVLATLLRRPVLRLEDGFLRSIERGEAPLSLMLDDTGVYYDATRPSAMEHAILRNASRRLRDSAPAQSASERASDLAQTWRAAGLSKYNHRPDPRDAPDLGKGAQPYVLVADQCQGDLSLTGGLVGQGRAAQDRFQRMLRAALDEHPDCIVLIKTHPDLLSHGRAGLCRPEHLRHPRLRIIANACHPARLIAGARAIYTLTSLIGFEGLIWGRPVRCFGMPFYAGWGLTLDDMPAPDRRSTGDVWTGDVWTGDVWAGDVWTGDVWAGDARIALEDLLHAAFIDLPRYADPLTGQRWSAEEAFAHAAARLAKRRRAELAHGIDTPGSVIAALPPTHGKRRMKQGRRIHASAPPDRQAGVCE